jgi:hypothetical protein
MLLCNKLYDFRSKFYITFDDNIKKHFFIAYQNIIKESDKSN